MFPLDNLDEHAWLPYHAVTELPHGKVLVLAPHPDDEIFGCGGAIMCHVAQDDPVTVVLATDGAAAAAPGTPPEKLPAYVEKRRHESRQAAQILGYGDPVAWDYADRSLTYDENFARHLAEYIEHEKFDIVYAPGLHEVHPDHYALAVAALSAIKTAACVCRLCLYEIGSFCAPNLLLDITPYVARKRQAIRCFTSQLAVQAYADHVEALNRYRTYTLSPRVQAAEAYYCLETQVLRDNPLLAYGNNRQTRRLLELQQHVRQLEAELNQVYTSRSWRATGILRNWKRIWAKIRNSSSTDAHR